jgi:hypothetical protein
MTQRPPIERTVSVPVIFIGGMPAPLAFDSTVHVPTSCSSHL